MRPWYFILMVVEIKSARELRDGRLGLREGGLHVLLTLQLHVRDVGCSHLDLSRELGQAGGIDLQHNHPPPIGRPKRKSR